MKLFFSGFGAFYAYFSTKEHKGIEYAKSKQSIFGKRAESLLRINKSRF